MDQIEDRDDLLDKALSVDHDEESYPGPVDETDTGNGILGHIKELRRDITQDSTLKLDIPGYRGMLVAEYRQIPYEALSKLINKANKSRKSRAELNAQTDILVQSCVAIYYRKDEESDLMPLEQADESFGSEPVVYDTRLATAAGVSGNTARLVCQNVFNNDVALVAHSNEVIQWMRDSEREDDSDF